MRTDQSVRRRAAHEERDAQHPEVARRRGVSQHRERAERHPGRGVRRRRLLLVGCAVRAQADALGTLAQQPRRERDQRRDDRRHHEDGDAPPVSLGGAGDHRKEDELSGRGAGGEDAEHHAAPRDEPAVDDRGGEHDGDESRADADPQSPQHDELPALADERRHGHARCEEDERREHHAAHADARHQRAGERPGQSIQEDVDRERGGRRRAEPAELALEREHQHGGHGPHSRRHEQDDEGDGDDDPGVVRGRAPWSGRGERGQATEARFRLNPGGRGTVRPGGPVRHPANGCVRRVKDSSKDPTSAPAKIKTALKRGAAAAGGAVPSRPRREPDHIAR